MSRFLGVTLGIILFLQGAHADEMAANVRYWSVCYHDVRDDVDGDLDADAMAVSTAHLAEHFEWLRVNGYKPISLKDIEMAKKGLKELPKKAILLTFDDGYASFYQKIFPLLQLFEFPAVFALVTKWIDTPQNHLVEYGKEKRHRSDFLSWRQVREMTDSGLIEIASHTHDMHKGIIANPQGNTQAATVTRQYDPVKKQYESDKQYRNRVAADLKKSRDLIKKHTGKAPSAIVWPYGRANQISTDIARELGMAHSLVLDESYNDVREEGHIRRFLISLNPTLEKFRYGLQPYAQEAPTRVVHVDLDYVYDADPAQQKRNLDALLDRIKAMAVNTVYLQAFADPDGDGNAEAVYFPTKQFPVRADLFNRVAWQLQTRAEVAVFAWMPVSSFVVAEDKFSKWGVYTDLDRQQGAPVQLSKSNYKRLSIFNAEAKQFIESIYDDLGKYASFDGVLFHDDGYLSDYEDVSEAAVAYYQRNGFQAFDAAAIRRSPELLKRWSSLKTEALIDFTQDLAAIVEKHRPGLKTARNLYAQTVLNVGSEAWFAQNLERSLAVYDHTAVMAMPYMENAEDPKQWLESLVKAAGAREKLDRMVFEIQSVDWRTQAEVPATEMVEQMRLLQRLGAVNFGYYPDNFLRNKPELKEIKKGISVEGYPYARDRQSMQLTAIESKKILNKK